MLCKDDVDKMVREAESHADEDKKRREEVELRNQAEQLTYQAERTIKDLGDKVPAEDRATVETQVSGAARGAQGLRHRADPGRHDHDHGDAHPRVHGRLPGRPRPRPTATAPRRGRRPRPTRTGPSADAGDETVEGEFKEV